MTLTLTGTLFVLPHTTFVNQPFEFADSDVGMLSENASVKLSCLLTKKPQPFVVIYYLNQNVSAKMSIYIFKNVVVVLWYHAMAFYTDKLSHKNFIINKTLNRLYGNNSYVVKSAAIV